MADDFVYDGVYYSTLSDYQVQVVAPPSGDYAGEITIPGIVTNNGTRYYVTTIGDNAFKGAYALESVTLPLTTITKIGEYAFNDCVGLKSFTIPASVKKIGKNAFYYCDNLKDLYVHSKDPSSYNPGSMAFSKIHYGSHHCKLHVPTGCTAAYAADATFSVFTEVEEFDPPVIYDLWVAGVKATSVNASDILGDGVASYDATTKTLTIGGTITAEGGGNLGCGIISEISKLTIQVSAPTTITARTGMLLTGSHTITGSPLLTISSTKRAIYSNDVTIKDANMNISGVVEDIWFSNLIVQSSTIDVSATSPDGAICEWIDLILTDCYIDTPEHGVYDKSDRRVEDKDGNPAMHVIIKAGKRPHELAFSATEASAKMDETFTPPTLTNPNNLDVTWTSSDESVAIVNSVTGEVILIAPGTTTITATFAGNDDYEAGSVSYDLTIAKYEAGLAFSETSASAKIGVDFTPPTLTNPNNLTVTWSSSDVSVATVDASGGVTLITSGTTTITAAYAGDNFYSEGSASYTLTVEKGDHELAFSETEASAKIGEDFTPPTLSNPNNLTVTWSSSDETVATVDASGVVTLLSGGSTTITATFAGDNIYSGGSVSYTLTVEKADHGLYFSETVAYAKIGEAFTAPTLINPNNLDVTWSSSDETIATVNASGEVTLVAGGVTLITATFTGNNTHKEGSASYTLTVEKGDPGLSFSETEAYATMGEAFTSPTLNNPNNLDVTWTSSDETVATVDASGVVTLIGGGMTSIIAEFAGDNVFEAGSAYYYLNVEKADHGLAFSEAFAAAKIGEPFTPPTLINPNNLDVSWSSSDESVATVSSSGEVTLIAEGTTVITAAFAGDNVFLEGSASYTLTVNKKDAVENGLEFSATEVTAKIGEDFTPPTLNNPNDLTVTWSSSDETVATIDANTGDITLVAAGNTTISAFFAGDDNFMSGAANYTLTVEKADPVDSGLEFSETEVTAKMGEPFTPPTLINPNNLTVTWLSNDEGVATVDPNTGEVTLVAAGLTTINAIFDGNDDFLPKTPYYTLIVEKADPVANGLELSETIVSAKMGEPFTPPTLINPNNLTVTWISFDEAVATVDPVTGEVTLVGPGTTTITAFFYGNEDFLEGSVSYTLTVNKADAVANGLEISVKEVTAKMGEPFTPPTLINPNNLTVTWTSSNEAVATVNPVTGEVTLVGPGTTTITAVFTGNDEFMSGAVSYTLTVEKEEEVGILGVEITEDDQATWYDIRGRKLSGKPQQRGVYIKNGVKVAIK